MRQAEVGTGNTSYMGDGWRKTELTGVTICHHFAPRKKNKKGKGDEQPVGALPLQSVETLLP